MTGRRQYGPARGSTAALPCLAPVLRGSQAGVLLELPAEAGSVQVAYRHADLIDGLICAQKQFPGSVKAQLPYIIRKVLIDFFFYQITDIGNAYMELLRQLVDGKVRPGEVLFDLFF